MSSEESKRVVFGGRTAITRWQAEHPGEVLDCSNLDFSSGQSSLESHDLSNIKFSGANFSNVRLMEANFSDSDLSGAKFQNGNLSRAILKNANLKGTNFAGATLSQTDFTGATFLDTNLAGASLDGVKFGAINFKQLNMAGCVFRNMDLVGKDFSGCNMEGTNLDSCKIENANFSNANLFRARIQSAEASNAKFDNANLDEADLSHSRLKGSSMLGASLKYSTSASTDFSDATLAAADFYEARVSNANFKAARGLASAENLVTVRLDRGQDVRYFDWVDVTWFDKWTNWERIRGVGKLPLFGASYSALVAIPFLFYLLDIFNRRIDSLRAIAQSEIERHGRWESLAQVAILHLKHEPIPSLSLLLLISTFLLGLGATLFVRYCPTRIKEFSRDQWRDQLGQSLIHYIPLSWTHPIARTLCIVLYAVGGVGVTVVILAKLWNVFLFILRN